MRSVHDMIGTLTAATTGLDIPATLATLTDQEK